MPKANPLESAEPVVEGRYVENRARYLEVLRYFLAKSRRDSNDDGLLRLPADLGGGAEGEGDGGPADRSDSAVGREHR